MRRTYRTTVLKNPGNNNDLRFRVMGTNNAGFEIIRLDGDLDLSEFTQIGGPAATDAAMANW